MSGCITMKPRGLTPGNQQMGGMGGEKVFTSLPDLFREQGLPRGRAFPLRLFLPARLLFFGTRFMFSSTCFHLFVPVLFTWILISYHFIFFSSFILSYIQGQCHVSSIIPDPITQHDGRTNYCHYWFSPSSSFFHFHFLLYLCFLISLGS